MTTPLPLIVCAGEALTDLVTTKQGSGGGSSWEAHPGGAAWNVARACARLGVPSAFAGAVGHDNFGDEIAQRTAQAGVDSRFLQQNEHDTLLAVVYSAHPPAYRFMGSDSADLYFDPAKLPAGWMKAAQWLHVGGVSLARWPLADTLLEVIRQFKVAGGKVSFDPNARITHRDPRYRAVFEQVIEQADVLKLSDEDLAFFFAGQSEAEAMRALRGLNATAPIVITRGENGATLYDAGNVTHLPTVPVQVADTVGAGDALCAGMLVSAVSSPEASWQEHLQVGLRAAAVACSHAGAYAPTQQDLQALSTQ